MYIVATIANLGAISVFGIGRKRRQRSERLLPRRTYRSSSVPRIQGRENGERVDGDLTTVRSLQRRPRNLLPREIREYISLFFSFFLFFFFFKFYISPCMNIGNLEHQAVLYFILFYFILFRVLKI
jgi:hypothetical protein